MPDSPHEADRNDGGTASHALQDPTPSDEALDVYILTRLESLGVDLSVLPEDDPDAPADRRRILASARRFLRTTPGWIADYRMDPLGPPPNIYPAAGAGGRR